MDLETWTSLYIKPQFYTENKTDEYLLLHWTPLTSKNELQAVYSDAIKLNRGLDSNYFRIDGALIQRHSASCNGGTSPSQVT